MVRRRRRTRVVVDLNGILTGATPFWTTDAFLPQVRPISALFDSRLAKTFRCSRYAERLCAADPGQREALLVGSDTVYTAEAMRAELVTTGESETALHRVLRKLRQRVMLRLIFRDINGLADLAEAVTTISALADITLIAALDFHRRMVGAAFGLDNAMLAGAGAQTLIVGMGKLGAHELNVSSDIDLIFVYAEDGEATAERSWHEFQDRKSTRLNSSHQIISYAVFCLKKKNKKIDSYWCRCIASTP